MAGHGLTLFFSYAHADEDLRVELAKHLKMLERQGIRCWVAPRDVHPGEEWAQAIIRGINGSRVMVLLFSGTVFGKGDKGFWVHPIPWHQQASYRMPVSVWREL